ncbi:hypothetical protein [Ornithinibacillus contaminans]|uniref:hypothetical protein n=1 Tax=Ornithinibacillus contaminans TaxID=694055 RepID=UPI00064D860C|nr:hypothetical protein [Ornithinibacillus contaminans]
MDSLFQTHIELSSFYDPNGNKITRKTEIRYDPLTGESSRVVYDPGINITPPQYSNNAKQTSATNCPFCLPNLTSKTPTFSKTITPDGQINHGDATVFPNLYPYSKYNGIAIFSKDHIIELENFTVELLRDAFLACQTFIKKVRKLEVNRIYPSINWNYLPYSGGSQLHPHLQVIISESATNYQSLFIRKSRSFTSNHGVDYLDFLYEKERQLGKRWIGEHGQIAWLTTFSPKGHNDFIAIFRGKNSITDITTEDWTNVAVGLQAIFKALIEQGLRAFNLAVHILEETSIHVRLIPRLNFGELNTSDFNYFQVMHDEGLTYKSPEMVAELARKYF